jgi:hypothetical protein
LKASSQYKFCTINSLHLQCKKKKSLHPCCYLYASTRITES